MPNSRLVWILCSFFTSCLLISTEVNAVPPAAPADVSSIMDNQGRITISWTDNAIDEGGYNIERRSDRPGAVWQVVGTTGPQAGTGSFIDPNLIIDEHVAVEYQYRIQAYRGIEVSSYASNWAVNCTAVPTDPEQLWLSQLPTQASQPIWGPSLPPPSGQSRINGWNLDGTSCSADVDNHFPCRYVMLSNDKYVALFIAGQVPTGGTGGLVNAGGLVGLTHRNYGMEFSGWDGITNQHIWQLTLASETDLTAQTVLKGGFQQASLSSVTEQSINGETTLVFEWNLPQGLTIKTFWSLQSIGSPGLHGKMEVTGTYTDTGGSKGLVSALFPQINSLGFSTSVPVNLVWPTRGLGLRIKDFKNVLNRKYLSTGLEAQFFGLEKNSYALYVSAEDVDLHAKEIRIQTNVVGSATHIKYFPFDGAGKAGNEIKHAQAVLTPLCGDWRRIGKRYRNFVLDYRQSNPAESWISKGTINARNDIPETIKRSVYWWNENLGTWSAEAGRQSVNFLKRMIQDGIQRLPDFNNPPQVLPDFTAPVFPNGPPLGIHLYNWYEIPGFTGQAFDVGLPVYMGKPGINSAISSMQSETQNTTLVVPYINATNVDITDDALGYKAEWDTFATRNLDAVSPFVVGSASGRQLVDVAINSQIWRDTMNTLADNVLNLGNTGFTGIYLDTFGAAQNPDYDLNQTGRDVVDAQWVKPGDNNSPKRGYGPWIATSNQLLGNNFKSKTALRPGAFVSVEHFSEAFIDDLDMVFLYTTFGNNLPLNHTASGNPDETKTEFIGLISTVYSDYQIFAGYRSSYLENLRAAAMKHGYGFVLGTHVGLNTRSQTGALFNNESLPLTICDPTAPSSFAWVVQQQQTCPARIAYMSHLAQARFKLQHIFRGEYLGPAEDVSPAAELNEYWCRGSSCQPAKDVPDGQGGFTWPTTDICSDGGQPQLPECAARYFQVVVPAIRGGTWIAPSGEKAIVLTNTDNIPRSANIPVPNSWKSEFTTARLCPADNPADTVACTSVNLGGDTIAVTNMIANSAWFIYGCASNPGTNPALVAMQDTDSDATVNGCDADDDDDGLLDSEELVIGTNTLLADSDGDGITDFDEVAYDGIPGVYLPGLDLDPLSPDSDGDGVNDGLEVEAGTDPLLDTSFPILSNGDINSDNVVNTADLVLAMRILLGQVSATPLQIAKFDVAPLVAGIPTPDGQITVGDYVVLVQKVTGAINF